MSPNSTRSAVSPVKLAGGFGAKVVLASTITVSLLFGMVLGLTLIYNSQTPEATNLGLAVAIGISILVSLLTFFLSPLLMDCTQQWLYGVNWRSIDDLDENYPETATLIRQVCRDRHLKIPRLGIIDDENPTAYTYGSLPNRSRLVVSQGLFTYLDDDEVATVYAHELGHIVHWDFAIMTVAALLIQIVYLIYVWCRRVGSFMGSNDKTGISTASGALAAVAYLFHWLGSYLILYLSRTREYMADKFAAEVTGNPNALSRSLVKIAYGIVEEASRAEEPSKLLVGTRALGIFDHKTANTTGTAYRVAAEPSQVGAVFLWDMFNPWGWWLELTSTHPLTGKRVRALSTYSEQLGIDPEFDFGRIMGMGKQLNKSRLYGNFLRDLCLYSIEFLGLIFGISLAIYQLYFVDNNLDRPEGQNNILLVVALPLIGLGIGIFIKALIMYPHSRQVVDTNVLELMSDPYASPLRGKFVRLRGTLIGRGDAGYAFGSDLMLNDGRGLMYLHYASLFGGIGNFLFGGTRVKQLIGADVESIGWFRRGVAHWVDLKQLTTADGTIVRSHHRVWGLMMGVILIGIGGAIIYFAPGFLQALS
jgi:Zn-dependent protease with chaperone function